MRIVIASIVVLLLGPAAASAQGAKLQLDHLNRLEQIAEETVNVDVPAALIKLFSSALKDDDEKQKVAKQFLNGLAGIYVRVFEFSRDNAYTPDDIAIIRKQLNGQGWMRFVNVRERDELVEVHLFQENGRSMGLAILVAEGRELVVVNIVGPIDLSQIAMLQGQFGIPKLDIPTIPTAKP